MIETYLSITIQADLGSKYNALVWQAQVALNLTTGPINKKTE